MTHSFPERRSSELDRLAAKAYLLGFRGADERWQTGFPEALNERQTAIFGREPARPRDRHRAADLHFLRRLRSWRDGASDGDHARPPVPGFLCRSEEHTSELQSLMRISYAVFCLKKKQSNNSQRKTSYHKPVSRPHTVQIQTTHRRTATYKLETTKST